MSFKVAAMVAIEPSTIATTAQVDHDGQSSGLPSKTRRSPIG